MKKLTTLLLLIFALTLSAFGFAGCSTDTPEETVDASEGQVYQMARLMTISDAALEEALSEGKDYLSVKLVAVVKPDGAYNKQVDWSAYWEDESILDDVAEYLTVEPEEDGSRKATIKCFKGFDNPIIIKVTTREGGFSDTCTATFVGKPTEIALSNVEGKLANSMTVGLGNYSFDINVSNNINDVSANYNNFSVNVKGYGSILVHEKAIQYNGNYYYDNGSAGYYVIKNDNTYNSDRVSEIIINDNISDFVSVSLSEGKLNMAVNNYIEGYAKLRYEQEGFSVQKNGCLVCDPNATSFTASNSISLSSLQHKGDDGKYSRDFVEMEYGFLDFGAEGEAYIEITISELNSGLKAVYKINISDSLVSGVILPDNIEF